MVLILDGNSGKGAHVLSEAGNLNCLMHLLRSDVISTLYLKLVYPHRRATCFELPSNKSSMVWSE